MCAYISLFYGVIVGLVVSRWFVVVSGLGVCVCALLRFIVRVGFGWFVVLVFMVCCFAFGFLWIDFLFVVGS